MWILQVDKDIYICSACGNQAYWDEYGQQLFDYCPYCGEYNRLKKKKEKPIEE